MSRGLGHIQRAIAAAFAAEPDNALTTLDLCELAYGIDANAVEKKHRIVVVRAAKQIPNLAWMVSDRLGGELVFYRPLDVLSYAMARLKADFVYRYRSRDLRHGWGGGEADLRKVLADERHRALVTEPGAWWRHVEIHKARASGDRERLAMLEKAQDDAVRALGRVVVVPAESSV